MGASPHRQDVIVSGGDTIGSSAVQSSPLWGIGMFKWFRRKAQRNTQAQAVHALHVLDRAIRAVHPDRFLDNLDAAIEIQPTLVNLNGFLGRPDTERFYPIEYEAVLARLHFYHQRNLLDQLLEISKPFLAMTALLAGTLHELWLRTEGATHDPVNLGREVQASTQTLIQFLNRCAKAQPEPMPR